MYLKITDNVEMKNYIQYLKKLNSIDRRIIEKDAEELGVPIIEPILEKPYPCDPNPVVAICGLCGLHLRQVMGYSCNRSNCPCFINFTC